MVKIETPPLTERSGATDRFVKKIGPTNIKGQLRKEGYSLIGRKPWVFLYALLF